MNYTFNKKLIEQVKAGTHCIEFNREKDSLEMLQALLSTAFPDDNATLSGDCLYYQELNTDSWIGKVKTDKTPIPLSNFVQPEQSERDVMAELDERLRRLEDILLKDAEICKEPEPLEAELINPARWRAEYSKKYYAVLVVNGEFMAIEHIEKNTSWDNNYYKTGNYSKTKEQAEEMAVLMQFTLNNPELVKQLIDKKE